VGLDLTATFAVTSDIDGAVTQVSLTPTSDGVYTYNHATAITVGAVVTGTITLATGYDIASGSFIQL
jgi:hypothetical protein